MPIPIFDGLWRIILKLFNKKGDGVAIQGVVCITVITRWQLVQLVSELTRVVTS